jgi:hypothetical protein
MGPSTRKIRVDMQHRHTPKYLHNFYDVKEYVLRIRRNYWKVPKVNHKNSRFSSCLPSFLISKT